MKAIFKVIIFFLVVKTAFGDVKGTDDSIRFNVNDDQNIEMVLNNIGLGLGTNNPSSNLHVSGNMVTDQLIIGSETSSSNLHISGSFRINSETTASNLTLSGNSSIYIIDTSSTNIVAHLPYAGNVTGRIYKIKKNNIENYLWIYGGGNHIDQQHIIEMPPTTNSLPQCQLISNGSQWYILDRSDQVNTVFNSDNLVGYWNFDETSGTTANDSSEFGNHGTLNGGFTFSSNRTMGKLGYALAFDGDDDSVEIAHSDSLDITEELTISLWYNGADFSNDGSESRTLISKRGGGSMGTIEQYTLEVPTGTTPRFAWYADSAFRTRNFTGTSSTVGQWYHLAFTVSSGNQYNAYFNGQSITNGTLTADLESSDRTLYLGAWGSTRASWSGNIDEVKVYNRALSADEISNLYFLEN